MQAGRASAGSPRGCRPLTLRLRAAVVAGSGAVVLLAGCTSSSPGPGSASTPSSSSDSSAASSSSPAEAPFVVTPVADLEEPWAMTFLPNGRALVTQRPGQLLLVDVASGATQEVAGVPSVLADGQGGLADVIPAPDHASTGQIFLSWVEPGATEGTSGGVVGRATLSTDGSPRLRDLEVIWRQQPTVSGSGHFSLRLALDPAGQHLFVTSGERQKMAPAQDVSNTLGTVVRLTLDGAPAAGNPLADRGGPSAQIWSFGHRNPLGISFDEAGNLWSSEMGPQGGDELNLIVKGANYGWPEASNGSHYGGGDIPDHVAGDGFEAPKVFWTPSISPSSLIVYTGTAFPQWRGDAFIGALSGQALVRVDLDGTKATKGDQWGMGQRIPEVEQGPDGSLWLLEDGAGGRLLKLTPR